MDYTNVCGFIVKDYRYNVEIDFWSQEDYERYIFDHRERFESEWENPNTNYVEATLGE